MKPKPEEFNPDPRYVCDLMDSTGMTQPEIAEAFHVNERTVRRWRTGETFITYPVQFMLEAMVLSVE